MDTKEFLTGKATDGYTFFGNHKKDKGYIFRTLAPNASEVYIIGDFNDWQAEKLRRYTTGVFSITNKNAKLGDRYQYIIKDSNDNESKKLDPFAKKILTDENCSIVTDDSYKFKNKKINYDKLNIYQVHMGALLKDSTKNNDEILDGLINHAKENNFTHISFMPMTEFINYKSMGYAPLSLFALSDRYGSAVDFKAFIDRAHQAGLGIIVEFDIAEFDDSTYGLVSFDGTDLFGYDHTDIKYNYYGSMNIDPSKNIAKSYIKSAISYWIKEFKLDGIYLSNIQNMVYWQGDRDRGINQDWIDLLEELIKIIKSQNTLALGSFDGTYDFDFDFDFVFDNKMRPIIRLLQKSPAQRDYFKGDVQKLITADTSKILLGFNYIDSYLNEASLAMKMFGDWQKIRQLKSLFTLTYGLGSAKMVFMENELASFKTWSIYEGVDFGAMDNSQKEFNDFYKDLSKLYITRDELSAAAKTKMLDIEGYSIYAFERIYEDRKLLVIVNFTDIDYQIKALYDLVELLNTEDLAYGGTGNVNGNVIKGEKIYIEPFGASIFEIR